jgi:ATP/maltotriose-dependent transcriptional regulator MalT
MLGRWDEALGAFAEVPKDRLLEGTTQGFLSSLPEIHVARGEPEEAARVLSLWAATEHSENIQRRMYYLIGAAVVARAEGRFEDALRVGTEAAELSRMTGEQSSQASKLGTVEAIEAALALGDTGRAEELVGSIEAIPPGLRAPYLGAQAMRFRAKLAGSAEGYEAAARRFRELKIPFWLAVTELEHFELTGDESFGTEAREIFERLEARPWLDRMTTAPAETRQPQVPA